MVRFHHYPIQSTAVRGIADVVSMIMEMGEDLGKEFNRELENCTTQVRCKSKEQDRNSNIHFRWSEPVGPFGFLRVSGGPPLSISLLAASLSHTARERIGTGEVSMAKGRSE